MGVPGPTELIILLVIILLLFGAKRIPELAKGLGTGMREFRKGTSGDYDEVDEENKKSEEIPSSEDEEALKEDASADVEREEQRQN